MSRSFSETSRTTKLVFFVSSVLGLLVGLAIGVTEGKALAARLFSRRTAAIERELAAFSSVQFRYADAGHARQAVLLEIRTREALQRLPLYVPQDHAAAPQQALSIAYTRLAMVEETTGHASAAEAALAKAAEQWCALNPGAEATPERLKQAVRDLDDPKAGAHPDVGLAP